MNIGLVSSLNKDGDIDFNIQQIKYYLKEAKTNNIDLLCFGESFIQGFESLTWDYEKDKNIALKINGKQISLIRDLASEFSVALSLGFIENSSDYLYSSNIVINKNGEIIDLYRRVSKGWKEPIATKKYMDGQSFQTFNFMDRTFATAICGDLWDDNRLKEMENINADVVLWPLYVDFSVEKWNKVFFLEYIERVKNIKNPVCMINSYVEDENRAKGGCYVFFKNKVIKALPMGNVGILEFEVK